jgi:hypothetical protein
MLTDWERLPGLPDCCDAGIAQTLQQRRAAVVEKLYIMGGNSPQYFIDMMARRGIAITIDELGNYVWRVNAPMVNLSLLPRRHRPCRRSPAHLGRSGNGVPHHATEARAHARPLQIRAVKGLYK